MASRALFVALATASLAGGCSTQPALDEGPWRAGYAPADLPAVTSIGSDGQSLVLGGSTSLGLLDARSRTYTPLVAGLVESLGSYELGVVEHPTHALRSGEWLYFASWGYRIQRVRTAAGTGAAVRQVAPASVLQPLCCQLDAFAADDDVAYFAMYDGSQDSVYARPHAGGAPRLLATVPGEARLTLAAPHRLYVATTDPAAGPAIRAIDLASGRLDTIQDGIRLTVIDGELPRAANGSRLFWMDGTTLRAVAHDGLVSRVVATDLPGVLRLAADESAAYALAGGPLRHEILRIDIGTGVVTPVASDDLVLGVLAYRGKVWWVSEGPVVALRSADPDGSNLATAATADGAAVRFGSVLSGVAGHVVAGGSRWLLDYDIASGNSQVLQPLAGASDLATGPLGLYVASWNDGIVRIPLDAALRRPETLRGDLATIRALHLQDGWLYWSEWSSFAQVYRIARMREDGTQHQVLFEGDHRELILHGGRLYFGCASACGLTGWTLVSMDPSGGSVTPEVTLGAVPDRIIARGGRFYAVDAVDPSGFGVWAIDVAGRRSAQVVEGLGFEGLDIDASAGWLYVWRWRGGPGSFERRRILDWNRVGSPEPIDDEVGAFHPHGGHVYYWQLAAGLKRLPE